MKFFHVDVFSKKPMNGNGLTVVLQDRDISYDEMLSISSEFKQFETVFLKITDGSFSARIFTVEEELDFAGHPVLGTGAVIHSLLFNKDEFCSIELNIKNRTFQLKSKSTSEEYDVEMNQGPAEYIGTVPVEDYDWITKALNISPKNLYLDYPLEIISTGLPYLIIPLKSGLSDTKIVINNLEDKISRFGAKFIYLANIDSLECRTWDNLGKIEDVATGSAAGPLYHYLQRNKIIKVGETITINQGKFLNRPSKIEVWSNNDKNGTNIFIKGNVVFFAEGTLYI